MISLTCPCCGATMELDDNRDTLFCAYCGQKIFIDHRTRRVRIEHNINIHQTINQNIKKHIVDEAEVEKQKSDRTLWIVLGVIFGIFYLGLFVALSLHG